MKYIDANELEVDIVNSMNENPHTDSYTRRIHTTEHKHILRILRNKIGIDARRNIHAHWIRVSDEQEELDQSFECSHCHANSRRPVGYFCRWCGAVMDDEENNISTEEKLLCRKTK